MLSHPLDTVPSGDEMTTDVCSIGSCERPLFARQLCVGHYRRLRKYGSPLVRKCYDCGELSDRPELNCGAYLCTSCATTPKAVRRREYQRRRRAESPLHHAAMGRRSNLRRKYGLSPEDYARLLTVQQGGCSVCGASPNEQFWGVLDVDHDHETDTIRGLLCRRCNIVLGKVTDDPKLLRALAHYIEDARNGD